MENDKNNQNEVNDEKKNRENILTEYQKLPKHEKPQKPKFEEKEYRALQKEIAKLPAPSFNNPEKAQPAVEVPKPMGTNVINQDSPSFASEDRKQKFNDPGIILGTPGAKLERFHRPKKPKVLKNLAKYLKPNVWHMVLCLLFALINSVLELYIPILSGRAIDCIVGANNVNFAELKTNILYLAIVAVGFCFFRWLYIYADNILSFKTDRLVRIGLFKKLNRVPLKYIDGSSHGDLQSRMINDVDVISDGFLEGMTTIFDAGISIVLTIVMMFRLNVTISAIIVALTPLSVFVTAFIAFKADKYFRRQAKTLGDASGVILEMLGNQRIVKAFNYEDRSIEKFEKINKNLAEQSEKAMFYSSLTNPFSRFINGVIYAIVAIMGTLSAIQGNMTIGNISVLLNYANKYIKPFNEISDVFSDLQASYASARRVVNVLDIEDEVSDKDNEVLEKCNGDVEIKDVNFSYVPNKKLIENLNVSVKKGQRVAIVGPTGCGKSTMINLLMRFYDVNSGEILVSEKPITKITRASLRDKYGMVLQDTWLFNASIRENLKYGKPDASDAEMIKAAKLAHAHDYIQSLENGYDTIVSEGGDNLSQGQKQLICIARIMLTKPPMLILDEATSNIDTRTELLIQNAFNTMMEGRTSFVVAHRLSTIVNSDLILVMNKGNIIEQGTHKELLKKQGFYYNLYNSQFSKI